MVSSPYLLNIDLWVELFSFFIAFLISTFSFYAFLLTKQKRHQLFCVAFLFLSGGILLGALFNSFVQFELIDIPFRGYLHIEYMIGVLLMASMTLILAGYVTLLTLSEKITNKRVIFLLYVFVIFTVLVSHSFYFVFNIVQFILIAFLFTNFLDNYHKNHTMGALLVMLAFAGLLLAQLLFSLIFIDYVFYLTANVIRAISFILFLCALISIYLKK